MTTYAQLPEGLILPQQLAMDVLGNRMFGGMYGGGGYRSTNPNNRNTAGWITGTGSADTDTLADIPTLRDQSSDLIRNEALPAGIIAANTTAVVGTGVLPQSRVNAAFLGITQKQADDWQSKAEAIFNQAADKPHWDAERKLTFWQQQGMAQRSMKERGDVFAVRRYIERAGKKLGLCVQLVEGDRVSTPVQHAADPTKDIRAGCEMDKDGAPKAWHFAQVHPGEVFMPNKVTEAMKWTRIAAYDDNGDPLVLPVIPRLRPGQTRGVPYLAPVIEALKQLSRYTEAEIAAAVVSGMLAVMVKSPAPVGPLGNIKQGVPGMVVGQQPQTAQGVTRLQSGMILDLKPGEEVQVVQSTRPNTAFDPFVTAVLRHIGAALEIPFEILVKHFTSSYSASRAALLEFWRFVLKERDFLVVSFCQPCWEWAITEAVATGLLKAPGFFTDPLRRAAWLGCDWVGPGIPHLDPLKEAAAAEAWNKLGTWSLQDISAQQGRDFDRTHRQLVREKGMREGAGLAVSAEKLALGVDAAAPADKQDDANGKPESITTTMRREMVADLFKDEL